MEVKLARESIPVDLAFDPPGHSVNLHMGLMIQQVLENWFLYYRPNGYNWTERWGGDFPLVARNQEKVMEMITGSPKAHPLSHFDALLDAYKQCLFSVPEDM